MKNILFITGLILILTSVLLVLEFSNSNRMSLIAGMIMPIGLTFNILGFTLKSRTQKN